MSVKWPDNIEDAKRLQNELRKAVRIKNLIKPPQIIAGVDAIFLKNHTISAVVLMSYPSLEPIEETYHVGKTTFPYIPGYLSFREGPAIIEAVKKLKHLPDV
ncbi:MAG: endonuclease V, partial [Nitrospirae bacterium]